MDWPSLNKIGYKLSIGKRSWSVWYVKSFDSKELVANGRKRPATPLVTILDRSLKLATADFVRRRMDNDLGQFKTVDVVDLRNAAKKQLGEWLSYRIDQLIMEQLVGER